MDRQLLISKLTTKQQVLEKDAQRVFQGNASMGIKRNLKKRMISLELVLRDLKNDHPFYIKEGFVTTTSAKVQL